MKLLLTGVSGLLGINFAQEMMGGHEIIGVDRGKLIKAPFRVLKQDLLNPRAVDAVLDAAQPEAVVNCAALATSTPARTTPTLPNA
ncbi:MAG: NAD-dependent epimerase/dehydratase family protein [Chloroflexi bacterium]|nr:NAD-dependent epimerase/dehydratase family protein [Chloroflexota bacterium]